jgi:hypothetical protein
MFFASCGAAPRDLWNNRTLETFAEVFGGYHRRGSVPKSLMVAAQYRERAARLRADADHVVSPKGREAFLDLAENWDLLADAAERGADRAATAEHKTAAPFQRRAPR